MECGVKESMDGKGGHSLLGDVHFEALSSGRVRCLETGHEMPESQTASYKQSKKCERALFDKALAHQTCPFNFFKQSPLARDKVICSLTGDILNKSEEALWKHMSGKKFQRKLAEKEAEKAKGQKAVANGNENFTTHSFLNNDAIDSDEADFWVPPVGDRWDYDDGDDRWKSNLDCDGSIRKKTSTNIGEGEVVSTKGAGFSDDDDMTIRTKRMSLGGCISHGKNKRRKSIKDGNRVSTS